MYIDFIKSLFRLVRPFLRLRGLFCQGFERRQLKCQGNRPESRL
uniref:Uncharacterized protein n=1 Tax=Anguilla anguilla TaxID=7936 RepID=A0A0E9Q3T7_ANGAN